MKKRAKPFDKELIKQYGEQTYRDSKRMKQSFNDSSWASTYVAAACGFIKNTEKERLRFRRAIINYARKTRFPKNFI
jgi:hypothetical protein